MIDVVLSDKLSKDYDKRYVIIDKESAEILDDAQGYGYKSKKNAYAAYAYKNRDRSKDRIIAEKKKYINEWCRNHKEFVGCLEEDAFQIAKGSYGPNDKFNAKWIEKAFADAGYENLPFTPAEFLKHLVNDL